MAGTNRLGEWLDATMRTRNLSQAAVARELGVADAQMSRWRRGQVRPALPHLQRIAETFGVPRVELERLAGYTAGEEPSLDPVTEGELHALQARFTQLLTEEIPRPLWPAFLASCEALAASLARTFAAEEERLQRETATVEEAEHRQIGFRRQE